jgi:membrane fusion protein (multidrug efflux system)
VVPAGLVLAAAVLVVLVAMMPGETVVVPPREIRPVNVVVLRVQPIAELRDTFDLTAIVEPNRVVDVAAEVAGRIERIAAPQGPARGGDPDRADPGPGTAVATDAILEEGDPIRVGAPIVYLNTDLLRAAYERAAAQAQFDQSEYERIVGLYEHDASPRSELDDARTRRAISKAMLDEAAAQLARAVIVAPIDGILNELPMEVGEYAVPGDCVAQIVDIDRVKVVVEVPERDVHHLQVGDMAEIFVRAPQPTTRSGRITYLSELADEQTRTTRAEVTVANPDHTLRSGQIARARLTRRVLRDALMIPLAAVIPLEEGKAVFVVDEERRARRKEIELGLIQGRDVRAVTGLDAGDRLIVVGHRYVGPGQPVSVVEER